MSTYGTPVPETDVWVLPVRFADLVDGDTIDFEADLGFYVTKRFRLRLSGIDTAETYGVSHDSAEYERGSVHKAFVADWLTTATDDSDTTFPLNCIIGKDAGKFGRWIGDVQRSDDHFLATDLLDEFGTEVQY